MKPDGLRLFLEAVHRDPSLQAQTREAPSLEALALIAVEAGFSIRTADVQLWAHDPAFDAPWWPWAQADRQERNRFFRGFRPTVQ